MALFRKLRVTALLYVLLLVAVGSWLTQARSTDWDAPLWVTVYPIDGDGREATRTYLAELEPLAFEPIAEFLRDEAAHYGIPMTEPVRLRLGPEVPEIPPSPPASGNPLAIAWWSLRLRAWSSFSVDDDGLAPDVRMFVVYHDPQTSPRLAHSLGLRKGLVGVVNAFAAPHMAGSNRVVIAHELLHTLGAADRYDPANGLPVHPQGYAEPDRVPVHPQELAEIMGGRVPLSPTQARVPRDLGEVLVGPATAAEIRWTN